VFIVPNPAKLSNRDDGEVAACILPTSPNRRVRLHPFLTDSRDTVTGSWATYSRSSSPVAADGSC